MNHLERSSPITTTAAILAIVLGIATTVHADAI
jgi:hypothetical protein